MSKARIGGTAEIAEGGEGRGGFWALGAGFWGVGEGFTAESAEGAEGEERGFWGCPSTGSGRTGEGVAVEGERMDSCLRRNDGVGYWR